MKAAGKISGPLTITGYSLGAHLATAFVLLNPEAVSATLREAANDMSYMLNIHG